MYGMARAAHDLARGTQENLPLPDDFGETIFFHPLEYGMRQDDPRGLVDRVLPFVTIEAKIRFPGDKAPGSRRSLVKPVAPET
jgi:hypothetical protein